MNIKKIYGLLFIQNTISIILYTLFIFLYKDLKLNDFIFTIVSFLWFLPAMLSVFLLISGILNKSDIILKFGTEKNTSVYEKIGKLFFAETQITGVAKQDFIDKNRSVIAKVLDCSPDEVSAIYGELYDLHSEFLKKKSNKEIIGFKK